jgi:hypothetical protein
MSIGKKSSRVYKTFDLMQIRTAGCIVAGLVVKPLLPGHSKNQGKDEALPCLPKKLAAIFLQFISFTCFTCCWRSGFGQLPNKLKLVPQRD